jgi:signal transduction histidine kinase
LQISDTGRGIPEDAVDYIFEPFRQVDGSVTRSHKGIGLGLSIVKQLVDLMEGSITVESQVGEGSTFRIELPVIIPQKESV